MSQIQANIDTLCVSRKRMYHEVGRQSNWSTKGRKIEVSHWTNGCDWSKWLLPSPCLCFSFWINDRKHEFLTIFHIRHVNLNSGTCIDCYWIIYVQDNMHMVMCRLVSVFPFNSTIFSSLTLLLTYFIYFILFFFLLTKKGQKSVDSKRDIEKAVTVTGEEKSLLYLNLNTSILCVGVWMMMNVKHEMSFFNIILLSLVSL